MVFSVEFKPFIRQTYVTFILLTCAAHYHTGQKSIHIKAYIVAPNLWGNKYCCGNKFKSMLVRIGYNLFKNFALIS